MGDDLERRKADETFKYRLIEQQAEIKALLASQNAGLDAIRKETATNSMAISEIRWALWGGPKESDVGLIEKHRKLNRNWTIAIAICAFLFSALGKIISPLYDKAITDWVYKSPSMKWEREQRRPRIKRYTVHLPPDQPPQSP